MKDRAYCDCGIVYLGSRMDDGLEIPPFLYYRFTYQDLARTLQRFLALKEEQNWQWDAVLPVDIVSLPLALALARCFGVGTEPLRNGRTLVVQALGETVEGLQDAAEQLGGARTFCLLACWPEEWRPDIVGLATPLMGSLPWYRNSVAGQLYPLLEPPEERVPPTVWQDPRPPEAIAQEIVAALAHMEQEPTLPAQLAYYHDHPRLRWR